MKISAALLLASVSCASAFTTPNVPPQQQASSSVMTSLQATVEDETATTFKGAAAISALTKDIETVFSSMDVDKFLPHRYPFALVDKIVEMEPGKRAVGIKCVTKNEDFFNGHFPGQPVMPGVLQLEALAQLAGCVVANTEGVAEGSVYFFGSADGVKWKKPVVPGDTLVMEVEVLKFNKKFGIIKASGKGYTDGQLAVDVAEMTFALAKPE
ncbi:3R-hydroxyacyl dehydrase [Nitzschia inconspicua]|uniref:3R-hydroxyacyl dehydrase n=1 Tax=Nitzschia inconspicua TaxID=303405 RepID=A0A9K3LLY4_9STRA|nr:3R-hydroxyacyl dehydrase [Nitzschia inconspicua]